MNLRQLLSRLLLSDPALQWMREQDAPRAKRTFTRAAIVALILIPLLGIQPTAYDSAARELQFSPIGFVGMSLVTGFLWILAWSAQTPTFLRHSEIELILWGLIVTAIGAIGYSVGVARIGVPFTFSATPDEENAAHDIVFAVSQQKTALVAWIYAAYTCLALLLSTRGQPVKPLPYFIFLFASVSFLIYDEKVFQLITSAGAFVVFFGIVVFFANWARFRYWREAFEAQHQKSLENESDENLLASFMTPQVHERMKRNERVADSFSNLTVIFADMVGFTSLSRRVSPGHLVDVLNEIFAAGDEIAAECGIEKVKTIGDCYMAVAGGIASPERGSADAVAFAQRYLKKVEEVSQRLDIPLALRVGIHTGPAVGGIIGTSRPAYDYWGDTVNLASRLESASGAGRILVSESTWLQTKRDFDFEDGTDIEVKGVGSVRSHFVAQALHEDNIVPLVKRAN